MGTNIPAITRPLSDRGIPKGLVYLVAVLGFVYLLNPTLGFFELLPDTLPIVGNVDEGLAAILVWYGLLEATSRRPTVEEVDEAKD